jgi:hypothetical protein
MNQDHPQYTIGLDLWNDWTTMWNGQPSLALRLVAPRFVLHLTVASAVDPESVTTPEAVAHWVTGQIAKYRLLSFSTGCGPFVDVAAGVVAGPWHARAQLDDAERWVCGMDTIAFRDGKITEYWTMSTPVPAVGGWSRSAHKAGNRF